MRRISLLIAFFLLPVVSRAGHALSITAPSLTTYSIPYETLLTPTGTTVQFTLSDAADVVIDVHLLQSFSDVPSASNLVAEITRNSLPAGSQSIGWDALWLIGGDRGRFDGNYQFIINASTDSGSTTANAVISNLLSITSLDIHSVQVTRSTGADGQSSFPFTISYALAKESLVTVLIKDGTGATIRTLLPDRPQGGEQTAGTISISWDGFDDYQKAVPLGIYTVQIDARNSGGTDQAITRTRTVAVESLANVNTDPKTIFENSVYVFPNPARNVNASFHFQSVYDNSTIFLKIYTINGDVVYEKTFDGSTAGTTTVYDWPLTNAAGKKVGRGLYLYEIREESPNNTLQIMKKLAVIQ